MIGPPRLATARCTKTLGQVDLITVPGLDVSLNPLKGATVLLRRPISTHGPPQRKAVGVGSADDTPSHRKNLDQPPTLPIPHGRMKHQLRGLRVVVADQCPAVEPQLCVWQVQVIDRRAADGLQAAPEIVAEITNQAAGKRQLEIVGQLRRTQLGQAVAQALDKGAAGFLGGGLQLLEWPGADQVETPPFGARAGAVEQHGPRRQAHKFEPARGVRVVGQGVQAADRHAGSSVERKPDSVKVLPLCGVCGVQQPLCRCATTIVGGYGYGQAVRASSPASCAPTT